MSWKESIRPDNKSEAAFYKAILLVVLLLTLGFAWQTLRPFFSWLFPTALILLTAYSVWQGIWRSYEVSLGKSLWLSSLLVFMLLAASVVTVLGFGLIITSIRPFLPNLLTRSIEVILFIVLVAGLSFKSKNLVSFFRQSLLERTFGLVPKIATEDYDRVSPST